MQVHPIAMFALLALGCSSSSNGTGAKDASVDMRVDTENQDGPASESAACTPETMCGTECCGKGYICTHEDSDPSVMTCSKLCQCDGDCPKSAFCCTSLAAPEGGTSPGAICSAETGNGCFATCN